mgnify:CR=1 FL=1
MKHKIFSHTSLLIILSVILTFLAAGTVMYNRYDIYMKQGVRDEAAYIKTGLEEDGDVFSFRQDRRCHQQQDHSSGKRWSGVV